MTAEKAAELERLRYLLSQQKHIVGMVPKYPTQEQVRQWTR